MAIDVTTGIITNFNTRTQVGKFRTTEGCTYDFTLAVVKDELLCMRLSQLKKPDVEIPVNVALYRSDSSITVLQLTRQPLIEKPAIQAGAIPGLPAEPGPYRDGKELYHAGDYKRAQERFLEAIRLDDRRASAVKDLASMFNEQGKSDLALILINQYLLTQVLDNTERTRFTNLRDNIHNRLAKGKLSTPGADKFGEQVRKILTSPPTPQLKNESPAAPPAETIQQAFFCIRQVRCFPLGPRKSGKGPATFDFPKNAQFDPAQAWKVAEVTLNCNAHLQPLPAQSVNPVELRGHWVFSLSDALWRPSVELQPKLHKRCTVYLRDGQMLAGPWIADDDGKLISKNPDFVFEWKWSDEWQRVDFPDRSYLLETPDEQLAGYYDFLDDQQLAAWLEVKLAQAGPEVVAQFQQLTTFCHTVLDGPLDSARWERLQHLLEKPQAQATAKLEHLEVAPIAPSPLMILGTAACRCLLVPSLSHSIALSQVFASNTELYIITPSVVWLGLRDAWPELEWVWNYAHAHPDHLVLLHIEHANLTLLHHWAKPLFNAAHGLCSSLPGYSDLPWPANLRTHWSLSSSPEAFPVANHLRGAFGALPLDLAAPNFDAPSEADPGFPLALLEPVEAGPSRPSESDLGDFGRAAASEVGAIQSLAPRYGLNAEVGPQIRLKNPQSYWSLGRAD